MTKLDTIATRGAGPGKGGGNNITCADGFTLSVVANEFAYCTPRSDTGPYVAVEVGFPSARPEPWAEWEGYCESPQDPTGTVYGWVPIETVRTLIDSHGGEVGAARVETVEMCRAQYTAGAAVRRHVRAALDTLGVAWMEHKGLLDSTFVVAGTREQHRRLAEWIDQINSEERS